MNPYKNTFNYPFKHTVKGLENITKTHIHKYKQIKHLKELFTHKEFFLIKENQIVYTDHYPNKKMFLKLEHLNKNAFDKRVSNYIKKGLIFTL